MRRGVDVGGRKGVVSPAESVGGIGFFGGDHAASWPLIGARRPAENDRANDAVAIDHSCPFLISHSAVFGGTLLHDALDDLLQTSGIGQTGTIRFALRQHRNRRRECDQRGDRNSNGGVDQVRHSASP